MMQDHRPFLTRRPSSSPKTSQSSSTKVKLEDLGRAQRITVTKENTTVIEGAGKSADIQGRFGHIPPQKIEETPPTTTREKSSRSASPSWPAGFAVINVGAATEAEMKEEEGPRRRRPARPPVPPSEEVASCRAVAGPLLRFRQGPRRPDRRIGRRRGKDRPPESSAARSRSRSASSVERRAFEGSLIVQEILRRRGTKAYNVATGE